MGMSINASYFPYNCTERWVCSLPAAKVPVVQFGDGNDGKRLKIGYDDCSFPAVEPYFLRGYGRTDLGWCERVYENQFFNGGEMTGRFSFCCAPVLHRLRTPSRIIRLHELLLLCLFVNRELNAAFYYP